MSLLGVLSVEDKQPCVDVLERIVAMLTRLCR
jgi:hypothetical protein